MAIQGLRDVAQFTVDGQRPKNFREGILMLWPNGMAPLTGLTSAMKSEAVNDPEFAWFEKSFAEQRFSLAASLAASAAGTTEPVTIGPTNAFTNLKAGHLLYVEQTGEVMRVVTAASNALSVVRGIGQTGNCTAVVYTGAGINPRITAMGTSHPEGDTPPAAVSWDPVKYRNYTQIFRDKIGFTRTAQKTRLRTGDQVKEARREALEQHSIGLERAFLWGKASELLSGTNGHPQRTTEGIIPAITTAQATYPELIQDFGGTTTMVELEIALEALFRYGSNEKMAFCGSGMILGLNQVIRKNTSYNFTAGAKEFGMNVVRLVTPFGTLVLKSHPLLNLMVGGTTGGTAYNGWNTSAVILDMSNLVYRYLTDSDTKYLPNVQTNGLDGNESEYLTECGFEVHQPRTHGIWRNLVSGIVDA